MTATILATGGAGYIGSHVVAELMASGRRVVILDDFSNAARDVPERIAALGFGAPELVEGDVCDPARARGAVRGGSRSTRSSTWRG